MPIYEFKCKDCAHTFEELCKMGSNGRGMRCPACEGKRVQRVMSRFAARSSGRDGEASAVGGSACSTCTAASCDGCK